MSDLKISDIDKKLCLYFVFHHRVAFRDFFVPQALGKPFRTHYYQVPPALCDELVWAGARGTGKSWDLEFSIMQNPFLYPGEETFLTAYRKTHIKDRLEKVITYLNAIPYLRRFFKGDSETSLRESVTRSPIYSIRFKNKHEICGISVGDDPQAVSVSGHHPCLHPGQGVRLADGTTTSISKIIQRMKKGEKISVKSYDIKNSQIIDREVIDGWYSKIGNKKMFRVVLEDNSSSLMTGNHRVYIDDENGKIKLKRVDRLVVNKDYIITDEPRFSKEQRSLVLGGLLGDSWLNFKKEAFYGKFDPRKKKNIADASFRIFFLHTLKHIEYVQFKYDVLKNFVGKRFLTIRKVKKSKGSLRHDKVQFATRCLGECDRIAELFFNKKGQRIRITWELLEQIDEKALAIWFMDDGSSHIGKSGCLRAVYFHTQAYNLQEHVLIKKLFKVKFDIDVKIEEYEQYRIYLNRENGVKLFNKIIPYMHYLFLYKVANIENDGLKIGTKINEFFTIDKKPFSKRVVKVVPYKKAIDGGRVCDLTVKDTQNFFTSSGFLVSNCYRYLEEGQFFPTDAWVQYQNTQAPGGSIDRYYGVSNGRLDSPFYIITHKLKKFKNKRFRVHRAMEPNWTQELKRDKLSTLKGPNSNDWIQQIEAQEGEPSFGVWNEADMRKNIDFTESKEVQGMLANSIKTIAVLAKDYVDMDANQVLCNLPQLPENDLEVILGIDAGYSQPTIILPFYFYKNKWNLTCKILLLDRMISDDQTELIDYIATFYKNCYLGIDCSSADGRDIATKLCNPKNEEYNTKQYDKRVFFIDFREALIVGYKREVEAGRVVLVEVKDHMKNLSTRVLRDKFSKEEFYLYYDEEMIPEFISETQKTEGGRLTIHTPPTVHIPEAYRCFAGAWWKLKIKIEKPPLGEEMDEEYQMDFPTYAPNDLNLFTRKPEKDTIPH